MLFCWIYMIIQIYDWTVLLISDIHKNIIYNQVTESASWCQLIVGVESKMQGNKHWYFPRIPSH